MTATERDIVIRTQGLTQRFGNKTAVNAIDLKIYRGEVYGFLGPNGSGKSTTIRLLCGLLLPTAGEIEVLGLRMPQQAELLKRRCGYMTQKFSLYEDLSVAENMTFAAQIYGLNPFSVRKRVDELLERYWLTELRDQMAGTLSGGQKQRLALATAVLHKPELLFLDEPTSAVDPESRREFWDSLFALADQGTTLLVSTHYMDEAERCHRLAILDRGNLVANGSPQDLMNGLPGQVLLVDSPTPRLAQQALLHGVLETAQVGANIRVLTAGHEHGAEQVRAILHQAGITARVRETQPNLEDVFVMATRQQESPP
jgi:ABC-2 type transport system ATP-binding protein